MASSKHRQAAQEQGQGGTGNPRKEGQQGQEINGLGRKLKINYNSKAGFGSRVWWEGCVIGVLLLFNYGK